MDTSKLFILLFSMLLGISFGAGMYEARIVLPLWFRRIKGGGYIVQESINTVDPGRRFWGMVTTGPLTLLTIINFILALRSAAPVHNWWLAASIVILIERLATFTFFIPTIIKLQRSLKTPGPRVAHFIPTWIRLNHVRNLLTLIAWVLALKALTAL